MAITNKPSELAHAIHLPSIPKTSKYEFFQF